MPFTVVQLAAAGAVLLLVDHAYFTEATPLPFALSVPVTVVDSATCVSPTSIT